MKPNGGWRPSGLFCSIYRLWGRCRRIYARPWEVLFSRPYFAGQSFASATDVVWRQMLKSEAANSKGLCSGTLLWDMTKFHEGISLE
eukprot:5472678-Pyramimonas_sp.AAC.1